MINKLRSKNPSKYLLLILLFSFLLNLWGINWGLPSKWHPDELTRICLKMVKNKSLNPHHFGKGALHYYQINIFVAPILILNNLFDLFNREKERELALLSSRVLSAILGTGIVFIIYLLTRYLFDDRAAVFSALLLTVSMGFVNLSHFATTDIASIFWFVLSCLFSSYILDQNSRKNYILAGLFAGFAAAVKYNAGLALVTLIVAHFLGNKRSKGNLVYGILMAAVAFIAANPPMILSFCEFTEGFLKHNILNSIRNADGPLAFFPLIYRLKDALGIPLFLFCVSGIIYSVKLVVSKEYRTNVLLVWSMFLPYYIVMGAMHKSPLRYSILIIPLLIVLTGKMVSDYSRLNHRLLRVTFVILFIIVISYSLIYTIGGNLKFTNDSRNLALKWITQNAPEGSKIETIGRGPNIPRDKYIVLDRPRYSRTASITKSSPTYHFIISRFHSVVKRLNLCRGTHPYYTGWFERATDRYERESSKFDLSVKGLKTRDPNYLVVNDKYLRKFLDDNTSIEGQFFNSLISGRAGYKKVAEFKYHFLPLIDPRPEFVNPIIYVYQRDNTTSE